MTDNTEQGGGTTNQGVEQITKVPSTAPKREKDPKRVAAGKKLAESNKRMREEHARYKASEESRLALEAQGGSTMNQGVPDEMSDESLSGGLISQLSLTNVIALVGIGLTVYTIFLNKSAKQERGEEWREPVRTTFEEMKTPEAGAKPKPKTEEARRIVKPRPKFGM